MLTKEVSTWVATLREHDQGNVGGFLETSLDYLNQNRNFLLGSGYFVVGSSFMKVTPIMKGDYNEKKRNLEDALWRRTKERFGEEILEAHCGAWREGRTIDVSGEIEKMLKEGYKQVEREMTSRVDNYGDIDLVVAGLSRDKTDTSLKIWGDFSQLLRVKFPLASHPVIIGGDRENGFGGWCVYDDGLGGNRFIVGDYRLVFPNNEKPGTDIHFMLFYSDEKFGSEQHGENFHSHWANTDVTLEMWKKQQEQEQLGFLTITEF